MTKTFPSVYNRIKKGVHTRTCSGWMKSSNIFFFSYLTTKRWASKLFVFILLPVGSNGYFSPLCEMLEFDQIVTIERGVVELPNLCDCISIRVDTLHARPAIHSNSFLSFFFAWLYRSSVAMKRRRLSMASTVLQAIPFLSWIKIQSYRFRLDPSVWNT